MKICGLTGGLGMGKSTAAEILRARSVPVVDTDELARQLVQPGEPALAEIKIQLGEKFIAPNGELNRAQLAGIVFADVAARKKLEEILHPRIRARWLAQIEIWRAASKQSDDGRKENHKLAVVVIPLLYETQAESHFDKIICVACSAANQHKRLLERGWSAEQISQRIAAQMPADQKIARADFVVWTDGDLDSHRQQLDQILSKL